MLNKTKLILYIIGALFVIGSGLGIKLAYSKYVSIVNERDSYRGNQRAYEDLISGKTSENRALRLSNADLRNSNDKFIQSIDSVRKSFKGAKNKPGDVATGIGSSIHTSTSVLLQNNGGCVVDTVLYFNKYTKSHITLKNNLLKDSLDVNNVQSLYVYTTSEYVNTYKSGWIRFWHFDWHKEDVDRYDIDNTNKLIKVDSVRVYKIRE